jgi:TonB family protein
MNTMKSQELARLLGDARAHAEAANYAEALACLHDARDVQPDNIYILAFEKQIEQLLSMSDSQTLSDDQKADILDSIPHIVDRALTTVGAPAGPGPRQVSPPPAGTPARGGSDDRTAALEWLKNQYFQHAHDYVQRGEYQHALTEIRRVFIIDPENTTAHEFEKQIMDLAEMHEADAGIQLAEESPDDLPAGEGVPDAGTAGTTAAGAADDGAGRRDARPEADAAPPRFTVAEPDLAERQTSGEPRVTGEPGSAGAVQRVEEPHRRKRRKADREPAAGEKKGFSTLAMVIIFLSLLIIGGGIFFLATRPTARRISTRESTTVIQAPPITFNEQTMAQEQTFVISEGATSDGSPNYEVRLDTSLSGASEAVDTEQPVHAAPVRPTPGQRREQPARTSTREAQRSPQRTTQDRARTDQSAERAAETASPSEPSAGEDVTFVPIEVEPKIVRLETPRLQEIVFTEGLEGQVVIQVRIDETGEPVETRILRSTNERLNAPVIDAVMRSTFAPGRMNSGPVTSWLTIPFTLRKGTR